MELCNITSDLVPRMHGDYVKCRTYRPYGDIELLEVTPEWVYGAYGADELIYDSNNHTVREDLAAFSDGMGGNCADHIVVERGMLCVPLWKDDDAGASGGYHPAAIVGLALMAQLEEYPLLDESDYSERETDAWYEYLADEFKWVDDGERDDEKINSHRARFVGYAWENLVGYYSVFDVPTDAIERAYNATKEN